MSDFVPLLQEQQAKKKQREGNRGSHHGQNMDVGMEQMFMKRMYIYGNFCTLTLMLLPFFFLLNYPRQADVIKNCSPCRYTHLNCSEAIRHLFRIKQ